MFGDLLSNLIWVLFPDKKSIGKTRRREILRGSRGHFQLSWGLCNLEINNISSSINFLQLFPMIQSFGELAALLKGLPTWFWLLGMNSLLPFRQDLLFNSFLFLDKDLASAGTTSLSSAAASDVPTGTFPWWDQPIDPTALPDHGAQGEIITLSERVYQYIVSVQDRRPGLIYQTARTFVLASAFMFPPDLQYPSIVKEIGKALARSSPNYLGFDLDDCTCIHFGNSGLGFLNRKHGEAEVLDMWRCNFEPKESYWGRVRRDKRFGRKSWKGRTIVQQWQVRSGVTVLLLMIKSSHKQGRIHEHEGINRNMHACMLACEPAQSRPSFSPSPIINVVLRHEMNECPGSQGNLNTYARGLLLESATLAPAMSLSRRHAACV